jgi:predicted metalloendopeptidase
MSRVYISVDQRAADGAIQVSIGFEGSHGYRIAGPKYDGNGQTLLKVFLSEGEKKEIRAYLRSRPISAGK